MECVRHQQGRSPCRGFYFRPKEGICELLSAESACMAGNVVLGTMYVHLSDGTFMAPYLGKTRVLALCSGSQTLPPQVGPFLSEVHWVVFDMWSFCTKACGYRAGEHSLQQESRVLMGRSLFVVLTFSLSIHLTRFHITGFRSPWATLYQHWPLSQVTGPMVRLSISHNWLYPT